MQRAWKHQEEEAGGSISGLQIVRQVGGHSPEVLQSGSGSANSVVGALCRSFSVTSGSWKRHGAARGSVASPCTSDPAACETNRGSVNGCMSWPVRPGWGFSGGINLRKPGWAAGHLRGQVSQSLAGAGGTAPHRADPARAGLERCLGEQACWKEAQRDRDVRVCPTPFYKEPCKNERNICIAFGQWTQGLDSTSTDPDEINMNVEIACAWILFPFQLISPLL